MKSLHRLLFEAHCRQLISSGAFAGNMGWVVTDDCYISKTNRGYLETRRIGPRHYTHIWTERE